ncbi:zinc ribbon domain-containing protein [Methanobrevibacter sp.]
MICPNCGKKSRDGFEYCRHCGSRLSGNLSGDFKTDMLNVFKHPAGYVYLFSVNGNQVVLKADSLDELAEMVFERKFPWEFLDWKTNAKKPENEKVKTPPVESVFLKASSLKKPEIINPSPRKTEESFVPDYEVSRVVETSDDFFKVKDKGNSSATGEIPESDIPKEYGIRGVFRHDGQWAFRTNETPYTIHDSRLEGLQNKVEAKEISWEVVDDELADKAFNEDMEKIKKRDNEILHKREMNREFYENKDRQIRQSSQKRTEEVEKMLKNKNMDKLLK